MFNFISALTKNKNSSEFQYPDSYQILKVRHQGNLKLFKHEVYLCERLAGEKVGIKQLDSQNYEIYVGEILYATFDRFTLRIVKVYASRNLIQ